MHPEHPPVRRLELDVSVRVSVRGGAVAAAVELAVELAVGIAVAVEGGGRRREGRAEGVIVGHDGSDERRSGVVLVRETVVLSYVVRKLWLGVMRSTRSRSATVVLRTYRDVRARKNGEARGTGR